MYARYHRWSLIYLSLVLFVTTGSVDKMYAQEEGESSVIVTDQPPMPGDALPAPNQSLGSSILSPDVTDGTQGGNFPYRADTPNIDPSFQSNSSPFDTLNDRFASQNPSMADSLLANRPTFGDQQTSLFSPRLARAPYMFGDSFAQGFQLLFDDTGSGVPNASGDIALAGGSRRSKISENSRAITEDRVFFMYNHFHNAINVENREFNFQPGSRTFSVDRFTLGFEKTFFDNLLSLDVRLPVTGGYLYDTINFGIVGGRAGNLALHPKVLLATNCNTSLVAGMTIDVPTGSDVYGQANEGNVFGVDYQVRNDAVHLAPFLGLLHCPNTQFFQQLFLQVDVPASNHEIAFFPVSDEVVFPLQDQELLYVDYTCGMWLGQFRSRSGCDSDYSLANLALIGEIHYTTTLDDSQVLFESFGINDFLFTNTANRQDIVNFTVGLHGELNNGSSVRVAGVFPFREDDNRFFDAEVQVQINVPL